jgi:hypothetical protein
VKALKSKTSPIQLILPMLFILIGSTIVSYQGSNGNQNLCPNTSSANTTSNCNNQIELAKKVCGTPPGVPTSIDFGCISEGNPITDILFAIIRFLSAGVGIVVIGSIIVGGMQYIGSRGEPQSTSKAIERIRSSVIALIIFIFGYAILNYIIPGGFLNR